MNANTIDRSNKARVIPTLTVVPVTHAIRTALAISFTLLALGGSSAAIAAGTCAFTTSTTVSCNGDFTDTVPGSFFTPVADLTLVLGDTAPTSVIPSSGLMGIDANWSGKIGVTSFADITTVGASGIFAYGSTSATVTNNGTITTNVTAPGTEAMDISAHGDVTVVNMGPVNAYSTGTNDVTALSAHSTDGNVAVTNQASGTITATAQDGNAIAVMTSAYGSTPAAFASTYVTNAGAISASSVNGIAIGVLAQTSSNGTGSFVVNRGSIEATSSNSQAVGVLASGNNYDTFVRNYGSIVATSGQDQAIGIEAYGNDYGAVTNSGSVTATSSDSTAIGVLAHNDYGKNNRYNSVTNSGSIQAISSAQAAGSQAVGIVDSGRYASVISSGTITATGNNAASAIGIETSSVYGSYVTNTGVVAAITTSTTYGGTATGIQAETNDTGLFFGDARVINSGHISATTATTSITYPGTATGVLVQTYKGGARVFNTASGSIAATAHYHNTAVGVSVDSAFAGNAYVSNAGSILASTEIAHATGVLAQSHYGTTTVVNAGDISALSGGLRTPWYAPSERDYAEGIVASSTGARGFVAGTTNVNSSGNITATGSWLAQGVEATAGYGTASVTNTGTGKITVTGDQFAIGIGTGHDAYYTRYGSFFDKNTRNAVIDNAGNISVIATGNTTNCGTACPFMAAHGVGIQALLDYGNNVTVTNSGSISVSVVGPPRLPRNYADSESAYGIQAITSTGDVTVDNSGSLAVSATGVGTNRVIRAYSAQGAVSIVNSGSIALYSASGVSRDYGIFTASGRGTGDVISIVNSGDISIGGNAVESGFGILAKSISATGTGVMTVTNSGHITVDALVDRYAGAGGIVATADFYSSTGIVIDNSGSIVVAGRIGGTGVSGNSGGAGPIEITNSGDIGATTVGGLIAGVVSQYGIPRTAASAMTLNNSGSISAIVNHSASVADDRAKAYGLWANSTYGETVVANSGVINATVHSGVAISGGVAKADAVLATSEPYGMLGGIAGDATVTNSTTGSITAIAESDVGTDSAIATGITANQLLFLTAHGFGGSKVVSAGHGITVNNAGVVSASAVIGAAASGTATATGILAVNSLAGFVDVTNTGTISASATTPGVATATGIFASGNSVAAAFNAGSNVSATSNGTSGSATGLSLVNAGTAALAANNAGALNATFIGSGGSASGATIASAGDVTFTNTGHILASNATSAVGVAFNSPTNVTLTNSGTITANSAAAGSVAVLSTGASTNTLNNSGTINGAIQTGAGNDTFTNAVGGVWNAVGSSDFGAGDDLITNAGTIHMNNAAITLGSFSQGNQFGNAALITLVGNNTITMGTGTSVNPNAFTNNGTLNFQNGLVGDTLAITGNFTGNGTINMDVSGLHGTSDQLQIIGNVLASSVNTVNVNVLDDPTATSTIIPLVTVTGTSVAGNFVLGKVVQDKSFLQLSDTLLSTIDASNKTPDVFALSLTVPPPPVTPPPVTPPPVTPPPVTPPPVTPPPVTPPPVVGVIVNVSGLSNLGTLAVSAAPGAQSLMNSQIGTLEQRMGAVSQTLKGGVSLWTRVFGDSGTVEPSHNAGNFGQGGNFAFDQSNTGEEVGVDFAFTDELKAGLLVAKDQANQHLDGSNSGSGQIKGTTGGVYATWISSTGAYLDASFRSMSFTSHLKSAAGEAWVKGDADAFNVEAGKRWTLGNGLQIAPQLQYTWNRVNSVKSDSATLAGFQSGGDNSSRGRLGVMVSKSYTADARTTWTPYVGVSAVHEFDGTNRYTINNTFYGETSTQGTSALVEGGVNVKIRNLALYGGASWQDGGAMKSFFGGQVGLRYTW